MPGFPVAQRNQRVIAIPSSPQQSIEGTITAAGTVILNAAMALGQLSLNTGVVTTFIHYFYLDGRQTGAASGADCQLAWQFRNAAHANVGGAIGSIGGIGGCTAAGAAGIINKVEFQPRTPHTRQYGIPGGAVELVLVLNVAIAGAPNVYFAAGFGIDVSNTGLVGEIGGGGTVNMTPNNVNEF